MIGQRHINQTQFIFQNLFEKGFDEVFSERIADASYRNQLKKSVANFSTDCRQDIHLVPLNGLWTVVSGDGAEILSNQTHYIDALSQARLLAKKMKVKLILHCCEGWEKDYESFQVKIPNSILL